MGATDLTIEISSKDKTKPGVDSSKARLSDFFDWTEKKARASEKTFGEDRVVKKFLQGGLVGYAGEALAGVTERAQELKKELAEGHIGAAGVVQELLKSAPLIGGFAKTGENLRELFTGEKAAIVEANDELARMTSFMTTIKTNAKETRVIFEEWGKLTDSFRHERERVLLPPDKLSESERKSTLADRLKSIEEKASADREKFDAQIREFTKQKGEIHVPANPGDKLVYRDGYGQPMSAYDVEQMDPSERQSRAAAWKRQKEEYDRAQGQLRQVQRQLNEAEKNRRAVEPAATKAGSEAHQTDFIEGLKEKGAALYATLQGLSKKYTPGLLRDKTLKHANILDELRAYDAGQSRDAELQDILANQQIADLDKRNAQRTALSELVNDLANQKQSVVDSLKTPGEKLEDERNYLESIGLSGRTLGRALTGKAQELGIGIGGSALRLPSAAEKGSISIAGLAASESRDEGPTTKLMRDLLAETKDTAKSNANAEKMLAQILSLFREGFVVN